MQVSIQYPGAFTAADSNYYIKPAISNLKLPILLMVPDPSN
jgi:hypothetical protein